MKDLVEFMRDVNHRHAARAQVIQNSEQGLDFSVSQRGRRLIKHDDASVLRKRLGDLDQLLLPDSKIANRASRVDCQMKIGQKFLRTAVKFFPIDDAEAARFAAEKNVLGHTEIFH